MGRAVRVSCRHRSVYITQIRPHAGNRSVARTRLLSTSIEQLLESIHEADIQRTIDAAAKASQPESDSLREGDDTHLWVDKYRPKGFTDLISDDASNREVLRWLKAWDPLVFHKPLSIQPRPIGRFRFSKSKHTNFKTPPKPSHREQNDYRASLKGGYRGRGARGSRGGRGGTRGGRGGGGKWGAGGGGNGGAYVKDGGKDRMQQNKGLEQPIQYEEILGPDGRPNPKLLLVSGPPGLGKTTLAHILARQAGYSPIEVNASDDRASSLVRLVEDSTGHDPIHFGPSEPSPDGAPTPVRKKLPTCLILDEIDGAMGSGERSAIDKLLTLVTASDRPGEKKKRGGKKARPKGIMRPIICVCNDPYTAALRNLRGVAKLITLNKPPTHNMVHRLQEICAREGLMCDRASLTSLVEQCSHDIRACLNSLQLNRKMLSERRPGVGMNIKPLTSMKDTLLPFYGLVAHIFGEKHTFTQVLDALRRAGDDLMRVSDQLWESYLHVGYVDPVMDKTMHLTEMASQSDVMSTFIRREQTFALLPYITHLAAEYHTAVVARVPRIPYPRFLYDLRFNGAKRQSLIQIFTSGVACKVRPYMTARSAVLDYAPLLPVLIAPKTRQVSIQLLSPEERSLLAGVVDTMLDYGLTYAMSPSESSENTAKGSLDEDLRLRPALYAMTAAFKGQRHELPRHVRQFVAREILVEKMRRAEALTAPPQDKQGKQDNKAPSQAALKMGSSPRPRPEIRPDVRSAIRAQALAGSKRRAFFFSKRDEKKAVSSDAQDRPQYRTEHPVHFRFQEGFTNAVRHPALVRDFL